MKSRSDAQLRGEVSGLSDCPPQKFLGGNASLEIFPCGLAAWSYFNDTYVFSRYSNRAQINISTENIAWASDKKYRFASKDAPQNFNTDPNIRGGGTITTATVGEDERFVNWMRTSALATFRKLWVRRARRTHLSAAIRMAAVAAAATSFPLNEKCIPPVFST